MSKEIIEVEVEEVNHPARYNGNTSLECIEVMEVMSGYRNVAIFCLLNAFKYMWRYKNKNGEEDLKKADWYLHWIEHKIEQNYGFSEDFIAHYHNLKDLSITLWDKIANGVE